MSEVIPIGFSDSAQIASILNLLGSVYNDPRDALKEYVANSLDADATNIVVDLTWRKSGTIQVRDDGKGMDRQKLRSVPARVGLSDKLLIDNRIGEKAIGILAFYSLGADWVLLWSRDDSRPIDSHCLRFKRGDINPVFDPDDEKLTSPWLRDTSGTVVELRGIPPEISRLLTLEKVKEHLAKLYREVLRHRAVRMVVVEGRKSEYVTVESFKGTPFWRRDLITRFGRVELDLYVLPSTSDRRIDVVCKTQRVCDLSAVDDRFRSPLWATGRIHGVISADFLKPTTGRTGFAANSAFDVFVQQLGTLESELQKAVDEEEEAYKAEQDQEMQRDLNNSFLRAILGLRTRGWSALEALVRSRVGERTGTQVNTGSVVRTKRVGPSKPGRRGRPRKRPQVIGDGDQTAVSGAGVSWEQSVFAEVEAHLRSKFDSRQSLVLINQGHPDFREEYPDRERRYKYFHLLLAKELTLYNWGKEQPGSLLEHLVELDVAARRYQSSR